MKINKKETESTGNENLTRVRSSLSSQDLTEMLKECRDLLVMCTLIDKSGHCKSLVDKVDAKMGW